MDRSIPDVLLLDIDLPGMLGSEGVREFRQRFPPLQIIMLTGFPDSRVFFRSLMAGAKGFLVKPVSAQEFLDAMSDAFGAALRARVPKPKKRKTLNLTANQRAQERGKGFRH